MDWLIARDKKVFVDLKFFDVPETVGRAISRLSEYGASLCGKVKFQITQKITDIVMCHCSECRRVQGTAFATNGNVESKIFKKSGS
jgi:hypothetical protein